MKKVIGILMFVAVVVGMNGSASGHFGMMIPSDNMVMQKDNRSVTLQLSFSHPMEGERRGLGKALAKRLGQDVLPPVREEHVSGSSVLMNPARLCIFLFLCEKPGTNLRALGREMEISPSTAKSHLDVLEEKGLLASFEENGKRYFYPPVLLSEKECQILYILSSPATNAVYKSTLREPRGVSRLAEETDMSPQLASYHLGLLIQQGLVKKEGKQYEATGLVGELSAKTEKRAASAAQNMLDILKEQNLSPSKTRKYKNRLRVEVTLGTQRKRVTVYLVPQTLG